MALPYFYIDTYDAAATQLHLDEDNSKHMVQVLRMKTGEALQLTDGRGNLLKGVISDAHKKKCVVEIQEAVYEPPLQPAVTIAISLLKNANRLEWFLEKATELGVTNIIPLLCERTEKQHFRYERMHNILVSALLQSQQSHLPVLHELTDMHNLFSDQRQLQKMIAHCGEGDKKSLAEVLQNDARDRLILIGPEGDFTTGEIEQAAGHGFVPVSLGNTRLRTETAGITAAVLMRLVH